MSETLALGSLIPNELLNQKIELTPDYMDQVTADYIKQAKRDSALENWKQKCPIEYQQFDINNDSLKINHKQINYILNWDHKSKKGIIAYGQSNQGKTRTMWELVRILASNHSVKVECYSSAKWFNVLQDNVRYGRDEAYGWVEAVAKRPIVFIDDFGQQALMSNKEDWSFGYFMQFLDIRVSNGLPLLMTTNLNASQITNNLNYIRSEPMLRRLLDVCETIKF